MGGVLFIDEAYSLASSEKEDSFSKECLDTLCESLSNYKGELMVIIAGYEEELDNTFFDLIITFTKEALQAVAKKAISRKTGARGLRSILEEVLLDSMYEIPSDNNINEVVLNEDVVLGKSKPIVAYAKNKKGIETSA